MASRRLLAERADKEVVRHHGDPHRVADRRSRSNWTTRTTSKSYLPGFAPAEQEQFERNVDALRRRLDGDSAGDREGNRGDPGTVRRSAATDVSGGGDVPGAGAAGQGGALMADLRTTCRSRLCRSLRARSLRQQPLDELVPPSRRRRVWLLGTSRGDLTVEQLAVGLPEQTSRLHDGRPKSDNGIRRREHVGRGLSRDGRRSRGLDPRGGTATRSSLSSTRVTR